MFAHTHTCVFACVCVCVCVYLYIYGSDTKESFCGLIYTKMSSINEYSFPELGEMIAVCFSQGENLLPTSIICM